jgi:hypothetical protein
MLKVEGHSDLYRDESTSAIINTSDEYKKYLEQRNRRLQQSEEFNNLKSEVSDIKQMMQMILEKLEKTN